MKYATEIIISLLVVSAVGWKYNKKILGRMPSSSSTLTFRVADKEISTLEDKGDDNCRKVKKLVVEHANDTLESSYQDCLKVMSKINPVAGKNNSAECVATVMQMQWPQMQPILNKHLSENCSE